MAIPVAFDEHFEAGRSGLHLREDEEGKRATRLKTLRGDLTHGAAGPFSSAEEAFARIRDKVKAVSGKAGE